MPYDLRAAFTDSAPPLGFRFGVFFFAGGAVPNPLDVRFKSVSGLGATVKTTTIQEGGAARLQRELPDSIEYDHLVLERGLVVGSLLTAEINATFSLFRFAPSNVLVTLFDDDATPLAAWLFMKAYPVKWSVSDFDAQTNAVVIETMELTYERMQPVRL